MKAWIVMGVIQNDAKSKEARSNRSFTRSPPRRQGLVGARPVRGVRIRRKARSKACRRRDEEAEVAEVAASFAGQSASSTAAPSRTTLWRRTLWRTLSPCAWCVCGSGGCRSCCTWPGNRGTGTFGPCVCGSGANGWSPVCHRHGISKGRASRATRRTSRDMTDRPARWASYLENPTTSLHCDFILSWWFLSFFFSILLLRVLAFHLGRGGVSDFEKVRDSRKVGGREKVEMSDLERVDDVAVELRIQGV